jgi:HD-like signal output (HDOD) protein
MKRRILFVDDEPRILEGLRDRLRRQRNCWEMFFVDSGQAALDLLRTQPIDVLVTDMRMPQMDGATLLHRVHNDYPQIVRMVLSGHAELETALRAIPVAHQFLTKPCDAGVLENVIERACKLHETLSNQTLRRVVGGIKRLPSLPRVYWKLMAAMEDERVTTAVIADILKQDVAMTAKLLQLVNSAFFRLSRSISKVEDAVAYLGQNTIKRVVLAAEVFGQGHAHPVKAGPSLEAHQGHAVIVANIATQLFTEKQRKEDAFIAGLLHDVGKLILGMECPQDVDRAVRTAREEGLTMHAAERKVAGMTHAELGGYLLGVWGLPYPIVEAVANHHDPGRVAQRGLELPWAVHVADALANELHPGSSSCEGCLPASLALDLLEQAGLVEKLPEWRALAAQQVPKAPEGSPVRAGSHA